jgi:type IX secretion system substrate protein
MNKCKKEKTFIINKLEDNPMKQLIIFITLIMLLTVAKTKSAEIIPVWNRTIEGKVSDMKFLKGQNEILVIVEGINGQIQRRNPNDGELIHSFPIALSEEISRIALTPDSTRFVLINGSGATLRGLDENFTSEKTFFIQRPKDSVLAYFTLITIDPIRPIAYVTTSSLDLSTKKHPKFIKVIAYNYETGEHIKDLTEYGEDEYTAIEVSHDGKYLATLNDNKAYLKVWDMESMELIINEPLFDENSNTRCEAEDIYFSKIDDNVIYISGFFSKQIDNKRKNGIFRFDIEKRIRERVLSEGLYDGYNVIALDSESLIFNFSSQTIAVLNLLTENLDWYGFPPKNVYSETIIYNKSKNYFIGASGNDFCKFLYDRETNINPEYDEEVIISPNPTNSFVNIEINCVEPLVSYQVNDINGVLLYQNTIEKNGVLNIDFLPYPSGVYFITLNCDYSKTYKIIKEG